MKKYKIYENDSYVYFTSISDLAQSIFINNILYENYALDDEESEGYKLVGVFTKKCMIKISILILEKAISILEERNLNIIDRYPIIKSFIESIEEWLDLAGINSDFASQIRLKYDFIKIINKLEDENCVRQIFLIMLNITYFINDTETTYMADYYCVNLFSHGHEKEECRKVLGEIIIDFMHSTEYLFYL